MSVEVPDDARITQVQFTPDSGFSEDVGTWSVSEQRAPAADPAEVVKAYYAAINVGDYGRAWDLGGKNLGRGYDAFASGFADTMHDDLTVTSTDGDVVHVRLDAETTMGSHRYFAGTYTVRDGEIVAAHLTRR